MPENPNPSPPKPPISPTPSTPAIPPPVLGIPGISRDDLRSIAKFQKGIIICILIYLAAIPAIAGAPQGLAPLLMATLGLLALASTLLIFLLAMKTFGNGVGIILGILSIVPLLGLIILLIVNSKATKILKQNGISVGFFGAQPDSI